MAFHFLDGVVNKVENIAHGDSKPGGGTFGFLDKNIAKPVVNNAKAFVHPSQLYGPSVEGFKNSFIANEPKVIAGKISHNQVAVDNANARLKKGSEDLNRNINNPVFLGSIGGEGVKGVPEPPKPFHFLGGDAPKPTITHTGQDIGTPALHLPDKGIYARLTPEQQLHLADETKNIPASAHDVPHLTQLDILKNSTHQEVPLSELTAHSPNAAKAIKGVPTSDIANKLVAAKTPKDAYKTLVEGGVDPNIAHSISPSVAHTKDPNIINNIIDKAHQPPPTPQDIIAARTPSSPAGEVTAGESPNKFLETIKNAPSTSPEAQEALGKITQNGPRHNQKALSDAAKKTVEANPDAAVTNLLSSSDFSDKAVAEGIHAFTHNQRKALDLIHSGQKEEGLKLFDQTNNMIEAAVTRAHALGQAVKAHDILNKLSPEGIYYNSVKKVQKAREANPKNIARQNKTATEIKQQLEKPLGQKDVSKTVKDLANEGEPTVKAVPQELSTGQKLAKKVEGAAAPPKPKKATDALVQELTKKVKQEYLDPKAVVKKDPLTILKETFGRSEEAKAAYPEAQQILRDKYADNEHMSNALNEFFDSKLDIPAAHSTIDSALRNQLNTQGEKVSQIIYKSHIEQGNTVRQTAEELVKEGFDPTSAQRLAEEVTRRLNKQVSEAKVKTLENMAKDSKERVQATYLDKLNKLSNLGALDKSDYLHLAQAKLNIPHLTSADASKISELSQKLQGLPEGHEKYAIIREISNVVHSSVPLTKGQVIKGIPGLMRTIKSSGDLSFGGRQGLAYLTAHPIRFAQEWPKQFAYFKEAFKGGDSEAFDALQADIKNNPDHHWLEKSGLSILDPHAHLFDQREEQFIGTEIADKIPGLRKIIDGSAYAYTGLANGLRANEFYAQLELARRGGREIDEGLVKDLAKVVDNSTGRGDLGRFAKLGNAALSALFAPRLIASRVNMLDPRYYHNLDPLARKEAVRQLVALSAFGVGILSMAKMAGADVEVDPRSADFGKIKVGDTRLDVLGGFTQYIRFGAQLGLGQKINSTTGAQTEVGKGLAGSRLDILTNFFENKANPAVSLGVTELKGKDISGNSVYTPKGQASQIISNFVPLFTQDVNDLFSHPDALHGNAAGKVGAAAAGLFGVGTQTYGQQDLPVSGKESDYLKQLQQSGAPKAQVDATKGFFQILKSAPSRTTAYDRIHQALDNSDYQKAQELAKEYNDSVNKHIQDSGWVDKNGKYINADLEKEYNKTQIHLTSGSIKQYLKSKEGL